MEPASTRVGTNAQFSSEVKTRAMNWTFSWPVRYFGVGDRGQVPIEGEIDVVGDEHHAAVRKSEITPATVEMIAPEGVTVGPVTGAARRLVIERDGAGP